MQPSDWFNLATAMATVTTAVALIFDRLRPKAPELHAHTLGGLSEAGLRGFTLIVEAPDWGEVRVDSLELPAGFEGRIRPAQKGYVEVRDETTPFAREVTINRRLRRRVGMPDHQAVLSLDFHVRPQQQQTPASASGGGSSGSSSGSASPPTNGCWRRSHRNSSRVCLRPMRRRSSDGWTVRTRP